MGKVILGIVAVVAVVFIGLYWFISPDTDKERQGFGLVLAIFSGGIAAFFGLYLTRQTMHTTREVEEDRAREAALRACLEQLGRLLTHKEWSTKDQAGAMDDTLRYLARAEALSVLGTLDGSRKRILIRFLYESQLIKGTPGIKLTGGDLREADLSNLNLTDAYLSGVRMNGADLSRAILDRADLSGSDLSGANLSATDLSGANLRDALGWNEEQLRAAKSLKGATMADGSKHP